MSKEKWINEYTGKTFYKENYVEELENYIQKQQSKIKKLEKEVEFYKEIAMKGGQ